MLLIFWYLVIFLAIYVLLKCGMKIIDGMIQDKKQEHSQKYRMEKSLEKIARTIPDEKVIPESERLLAANAALLEKKKVRDEIEKITG